MWNVLYESSRQENVRVEKTDSWNAQSLLNVYEQHGKRRDSDWLRVGRSVVWILTEARNFFFFQTVHTGIWGISSLLLNERFSYFSGLKRTGCKIDHSPPPSTELFLYASVAWKGVIFEEQSISNNVWTIYLRTEVCSLLWQYFMFSEQNYIRHRSYGLPYKALIPSAVGCSPRIALDAMYSFPSKGVRGFV